MLNRKELNKKILSLTLPNIITNTTVPLLGLVDTAIVGHIADSGEKIDYIGAIAIGTMIFNFIYWNFGFLRMGTSGFTAQAYGAKDKEEQGNILFRACFIAFLSATLLISLQYPISRLCYIVIDDKNNVMDLAMQYFNIRIWAAFATLGMYALKGWFIGLQDSKTPMFISIFINVVNIIFSLLFVIKFNMKIKGVAYGTVIAQYSGLIMTIIFAIFKYKGIKISVRKAISWEKMKIFFKVNSDIFLRSACIIAVTTYFTIASSRMPYPLLAVNSLIMQLFTLFSYFMDGFAYASESLCGRFVGAKEKDNLRQTVKYILLWGLIMSILCMIIYGLFGNEILKILTDKQEVLIVAKKYMIWTIIIPIAGFAAFLYDGILIGMIESVIMRNAIFISTFAFFVLYFLLEGVIGNNALWFAFIAYLVGRSLFMMWFSWKKIFGKENLN